MIRSFPSGKASVSRTRLSHHEMPATCPSTSTCASTSSSSTLCTSLRNSRLLKFFFIELASPSTMEKSGPMCAHLIARKRFSPSTTAMRYQVPLSNSKREGSTTTDTPLIMRWAIWRLWIISVSRTTMSGTCTLKSTAERCGFIPSSFIMASLASGTE